MGMFRRKEAANIEGEVCPYCEFVNSTGATTCSQCYYDLNKAPRDQGEQLSPEISNSLFDELMSDEDDSWEDGDALEVVLTLDQDPLEVEQYATTDFSAEEPEKIDFLDSSKPELNETVTHRPNEVTVEDVGEAITNVEKLDFSKDDPFAEISEPVHQGKGAVFSPSTPSKLDDDLLGHVGGKELPSLPSDDEIYGNKIDLTAKKAPSPTPSVVLPSSPLVQSTTVEPHNVPLSDSIPDDKPVATIVEQQTDESVSVEDEPVSEPVIPTNPVFPEPSIEQRIWPWAAGELWDPRIVHREVVSALEQVKSGHIAEATVTIDALGPHLGDENIDLIYHIGMVLKQLNRIDEVKTMLETAQVKMPGNEHVSSALTYLDV
jgi:hypothetical protein